jgi:SAM-dependent methyltransferase
VGEYVYPGGELELFAGARNWKGYYAGMVRPFLGERVLEVGAGLGATGQALCLPRHREWLCLEPDEAMSRRLAQLIDEGRLPDFFRGARGTVADLPPGDLFDSILYIDVLEHIEGDAEEARRALAHLRPGGFLIVLAPAHQFLYSPFDRAIGHFRRYSRRALARAVPEGLECRLLRYLDSAGFFASLGNRLLLKAARPGARQILLWDRVMVPVSRVLDRLLLYRFGKSVLGVWRKP